MELFDRDFPGHYLRLIKRVRTSVIALIPAVDAIRATLTDTGTSRVVVVGGDIFQTVTISHGPDYVALSSPRDATGLFELDAQSDMRLPFEGIGVNTGWKFCMPRSANLFDYGTIADVLITIEYTALNSADYRKQVIKQLNDTPLSAVRPFSFGQDFEDQWYALNNPDQSATPMTVRFETAREDFPPNIEDLRIQQVVLFFVRTGGSSFEVPVTAFRLTVTAADGHHQTFPDPTDPNQPAGATTVDGVLSTCRGNAPSGWTAMIGQSPFGEWELVLPAEDQQVRDRFRKGDIKDLLFVIYKGRTPEWPP